MFEAEEALVVDVLQLPVPGTERTALVIEGVIGTGKVEAVAADLALRHMAEHGLHLLVAGFVTQAGRPQVATLHSQAIDLVGADTGALVAGRQQANIAEDQYRQVRLQLSNLQLGPGVTHFQRTGQAAVVIGGTPVTLHRQQAGIDPVRAAVELEAQQADDIHAKPDGALGIPGLDVEDEALRPLLGLRLRVSPDDVGEVAAEVVIAGLQGGAGVFDEATLGSQCASGKTRGERQGQHGTGCWETLFHRCSLIVLDRQVEGRHPLRTCGGGR
ncbi:hypothetical protein D3C71_1466920 [compost metagenome]